MSRRKVLQIHNGHAIARDRISRLPLAAFQETVLESVRSGARVCAYFGVPHAQGQTLLHAVLTDDLNGELFVVSTPIDRAYPALTPHCPQLHLFERELAENCGIQPEGHPWLKPVRAHTPAGERPTGTAFQPGPANVDAYPYFSMAGSEIHEVAVGPVHAGIIEPGHFRFQCHGERVFHLEIRLGYQHRGIEPALVGGPDRRSLVLAESICGDTVIGHTLAYCQALEGLAIGQVPPRAQALRGIALELERLANHIGDLGALATDIGFLPASAYFGRLRGEMLNLLFALTGNRFGRGFVRPGGVQFDLTDAMTADFTRKLTIADRQLTEIAEMFFETPSVLARLENVGTVSARDARALGLVGPAARACGLDLDVRRDHPAGIYRMSQIPVMRGETGDVFARALVRWLEIERAIDFIRAQLPALPSGRLLAKCDHLQSDHWVVSLVEGWRGEIAHLAATDGDGRFGHYKIIDPSFHNWMGLEMALRNEQISDFPLCNKSFNLSYAGFDL